MRSLRYRNQKQRDRVRRRGGPPSHVASNLHTTAPAGRVRLSNLYVMIDGR